jgi:hypothetical protein
VLARDSGEKAPSFNGVKILTFLKFNKVMAEREGFEPPIPLSGMPLFESGALSHYATSPYSLILNQIPTPLQGMGIKKQ